MDLIWRSVSIAMVSVVGLFVGCSEESADDGQLGWPGVGDDSVPESSENRTVEAGAMGSGGSSSSSTDSEDTLQDNDSDAGQGSPASSDDEDEGDDDDDEDDDSPTSGGRVDAGRGASDAATRDAGRDADARARDAGARGGGTACAPRCKEDDECQSSCPATLGLTYCCVKLLGICMPSLNKRCGP